MANATSSTTTDKRSRFVSVAALLASVLAVVVAVQQRNLADNQLRAQRYQAVYDRLLDHDKFMLEQPKLLGYLRRPARNARRGLTHEREVGLLWVLDFYYYVWNQVPEILESPLPDGLALRKYPEGAKRARPPADTEDEDLEAWTTWSETIAAGFYAYTGAKEPVPSALCVVLDDNAHAYGTDFVAAIRAARLCPGK